jgi:tagatose 6-phosphate kinase
MTEIYEKGDPIPIEKVSEMLEHFRGIIGKYKAVSLSGSIPPGVPQDIYGQLIMIAHQANVPVFLDSSKEALFKGVAAKPFLIKPNETEVSILSERTLTGFLDYAQAAAEISQRYETIVVLSLGKAGAIAANDEVIHVQNPSVNAKSAVGSGDSMLAGLVYGFSRGLALAEAVTQGVAAGTANTLRIGAGQFSMQDFEAIKSQTSVKILKLTR